ncbi:hypothetical protein [Flavonifractor hominis]|uniref:Lipoprotein n=1 Tax=Flavonifractor hominis TaxID=3133178 RepID=A0ABV1ESZ1_9FIRM
MKRTLLLALSAAALTIALAGCTPNVGPDATHTPTPTSTSSMTGSAGNAMQDAGDAARDIADGVGDAARDAVDGAKDAARDIGNGVKQAVQ